MRAPNVYASAVNCRGDSGKLEAQLVRLSYYGRTGSAAKKSQNQVDLSEIADKACCQGLFHFGISGSCIIGRYRKYCCFASKPSCDACQCLPVEDPRCLYTLIHHFLVLSSASMDAYIIDPRAFHNAPAIDLARIPLAAHCMVKSEAGRLCKTFGQVTITRYGPGKRARRRLLRLLEVTPGSGTRVPRRRIRRVPGSRYYPW